MDMQSIENLVKEVHYPVTKQELLQFAEQKGMEEGKALLAKLPEQKFSSAEEVLSKLPLGNLGGIGGLQQS